MKPSAKGAASGARGLRGIGAVLVALCLLSGCASLDVPERPGRVRLDQTGAAALEGLYAYEGSACGAAEADSLARGHYRARCQVGFGDVLGVDDRILYAIPPERWVNLSDLGATVRLDALGRDRLRATLTSAGGKTWQEEIRLSLRPDGYARLRTRSGLAGFPPLVWALRDVKAQIGLNADGDLTFDRAAGGMAFFTLIPIFFDGEPPGPVTFRRLAPAAPDSLR
ncbi:hypothetical protein [Rubricoccus marinus]|uniref:Uncharacterized protein n=1 Tax=Rubricoccus marinus TaxID=716817 RepID=A0A259U1V8_9BACT|nr:hypothetical protein [Rubricoccus marinus]OZC03828.1 hypothetical protein BSZ36_13030 [Rubricoccus marinus]